MAGRGAWYGVTVACKKRLHALTPFLGEHRAGAVKQVAAWPQQRPQRLQQTVLLGGQLCKVRFAPQPAHVGVTADDAGGAAGGVEQDGVVALAPPPGRQVGGVGHAHLGVQAQARQRIADAGAALRIDPNASYATAEAVDVCRALEPLALEYYEDPTDGIDGLARVRRQVTRPIASNMAAVEWGHLAPAARRGAPDVVLADLFLWGGVEPYRDVAAAADALGLGCALHSFYESGVATAANVHLALGLGLTAHANDQGLDGLAADVLVPGALEVRDGRIALPAGPGLGVALDEARVRPLLSDETIVE